MSSYGMHFQSSTFLYPWLPSNPFLPRTFGIILLLILILKIHAHFTLSAHATTVTCQMFIIKFCWLNVVFSYTCFSLSVLSWYFSFLTKQLHQFLVLVCQQNLMPIYIIAICLFVLLCCEVNSHKGNGMPQWCRN